jgi:acyl-CoA reductase-like NAD-dependent aldehyde dehydrogenase/pimeloyl-ACP methyl ester carboxylesterase
MTIDDKPRLLLVHGAWVGPWEFDPLVAVLRDRGWQVDALALPSVGSTTGIAEDAAVITAAVEASVEPVVLVGHSYGGIPVTEAGGHDNVERIIYVTAFALDKGESASGSMGGSLPEWWGIAGGQVTMGRSREERVAMIAADLPPEAAPVAEQLADLFRPQSLRALTESVTRVAWREKPTTYVLTERDSVLPPAFQEFLATRSTADIVRIPHGHAPFQEDPAGFADVLERVTLTASANDGIRRMTTTVTGTPSPSTATFVPGKLFIGGEWADASDGARADILNPATGDRLTDVAAATISDVDAAVTAAREAFDSCVWSGLSSRERARILQRAYELMRDRTEELAQAESANVGKPITFARLVDVNNAAELYEYYASLGHHLDGSVRETTGNTHAYVKREPLGVVAAITPFNFPLILSSSKIAPALIAGNTVVHKPASDTPLSALIMAEILTEAGVPAGVFNVITGSGSTVGDYLVSHPGVDKVAFTGSTAIGAHAAALAAQALKPFTAELGGNAANIVFADADLDQAIRTVISAFVFNTGQFCMAGPRLLVERPIYETVLGILETAVPHVPFGDPRDPATVIGPLASAAQLKKVADIVGRARVAGATVVTGGSTVDLDGGFYYQPTVLADLPDDAEAVVEEIFGPVLTVQPFDTEDEAVALANATAYGLASGVQTSDLAKAHRVAAKLQAGITWVNGWALLDPSVPFGGVKASGWGREGGAEAMESYQRAHSIVFNLEQGAHQ